MTKTKEASKEIIANPNASFAIEFKKKDPEGICTVEAKCPRRLAEKMGDLWDNWFEEEGYLEEFRKND